MVSELPAPAEAPAVPPLDCTVSAASPVLVTRSVPFDSSTTRYSKLALALPVAVKPSRVVPETEQLLPPLKDSVFWGIGGESPHLLPTAFACHDTPDSILESTILPAPIVTVAVALLAGSATLVAFTWKAPIVL